MTISYLAKFRNSKKHRKRQAFTSKSWSFYLLSRKLPTVTQEVSTVTLWVSPTVATHFDMVLSRWDFSVSDKTPERVNEQGAIF